MHTRKIIASDTLNEDDSFEHQYSSLRVNMSYIANLTDSDDSLHRSEVESTEGAKNNRNLQRSQGICNN